MLFIVEVGLKDNFRDACGEDIRHNIMYTGIKQAPKIRCIKLYQIEGNLNLREINAISKELLTDPVNQSCTIQCYSDGINKLTKKKKSGRRHEVEVWLRQGVTDTVAESVQKAIADLGIKKQLSVKTGHKYLMEGSVNLGVVKKITERLLVNKLIQKYYIG